MIRNTEPMDVHPAERTLIEYIRGLQFGSSPSRYSTAYPRWPRKSGCG